MEAVYGENAGAGRAGAGAAGQALRHLCPDVNGLLYAGGAGDADAADHGE